jgi:transposase
MQTITTIGLDIAKSVFQDHGVDADGNIVIRRQVKRRYVLAFFQKLPPCLVGIEACASSHHWSRELQALGHTVRLMPPAYVKPYVKRHKNIGRYPPSGWCAELFIKYVSYAQYGARRGVDHAKGQRDIIRRGVHHCHHGDHHHQRKPFICSARHRKARQLLS